MTFDAFNNGEKEATISWEIADRSIANYLRSFDPSPKTYITYPNRNVQYTVEFVSSQPIDDETLKKAIRIRAKGSNGQNLLVNGESSILLALQPSGYEDYQQPLQRITITQSGTRTFL